MGLLAIVLNVSGIFFCQEIKISASTVIFVPC